MKEAGCSFKTEGCKDVKRLSDRGRTDSEYGRCRLKEDMAADVLNCLKQGQKKKGLMLLQRQRKALLDGIHKDQSCIEYLDGVLGGMRKGGT